MRRNYAQFAKTVVKDVLKRLGRPALHVADMPVDVQQRVAGIRQTMDEIGSSSGCAVLGLHGMGGIGKTTLAKAVFNELRSGFVDSACFLEVGMGAGSEALQRLQGCMLKELCGVERQLSSPDQGRGELEARLPQQRMLLVIDDVWSEAQLDALLTDVGAGSRVLVTTREPQLLRSRPSITCQPVEVLGEDAALELFSWHAFLSPQPPADYRALAADAAAACGGLPLTLSVIGAHLWNQHSREDWEQALLRLKSAKPFTGGKMANDQLWGKLRLSFDALGDDEQQVFLDIACFMLGKAASGEALRACMPAWGEVAASTLQNLVGRSLISYNEEGGLKVHDQLRDLGRAIAMGESASGRQRSRVWMPDALSAVAGMRVRLATLAGAQAACTSPTVTACKARCPHNSSSGAERGRVCYRSEPLACFGAGVGPVGSRAAGGRCGGARCRVPAHDGPQAAGLGQGRAGRRG